MENLGLSRGLKVQIKEYFINTFSRKSQQVELNQFLAGISPSLKLQISFQIFHSALESNIVFYSFLNHGHGHGKGGNGHGKGGHGGIDDHHGHHDDEHHEHDEHHHEGGEHEGGHHDEDGHTGSPILNFVVKRLEVELATPENVFIS